MKNALAIGFGLAFLAVPILGSAAQTRGSTDAAIQDACSTPPPHDQFTGDYKTPPPTRYDVVVIGEGSNARLRVARLKTIDIPKPAHHAYVSYNDAKEFFGYLKVKPELDTADGTVTLTGKDPKPENACVVKLYLNRTARVYPAAGPTGPPVSIGLTPMFGPKDNPLIPMRFVAERFTALVEWCGPPTDFTGKLCLRRSGTMRGLTPKYVEVFGILRRYYRLGIDPKYKELDPGRSISFKLSLIPFPDGSGPRRLIGRGSVNVTPPDPTQVKATNRTVTVLPDANGTFKVVPSPDPADAPRIVPPPESATLVVPEYDLRADPASTIVPQGTPVKYTLYLKKRPLGTGTPEPEREYHNGNLDLPPGLGTTTSTTPTTSAVNVSPSAPPTAYTITPKKRANDLRHVNSVASTLTVTRSTTTYCSWDVVSPVSVPDGKPLFSTSRMPTPVPRSGSVLPAPVPTPSFSASPMPLLDPNLNVHAIGGNNTGTVTVSGGTCEPAKITVTVIVPPLPLLQHSAAVDYGQASIYDELSPGNVDWNKLLAHAELQVTKSAWLSVDARSIGYRHDARSTVPLACPPAPPAPAAGGAPPGDEGCITVIGGASQTYRTAFVARDTSTEVRGGFSIEPTTPIVAELAYMTASNNAFRPSVSGLGVALEKPPSLSQYFAPYGAISYYPRVSGGGISYHVFRYRAGVTYTLQPKAPSSLFLELAAVGDRRTNASNAPSSSVYQAISLGLGVKF